MRVRIRVCVCIEQYVNVLAFILPYSSLKLVYIFSVNPHLGPLQVSLSRMVMDIMKFFFLYVLVLFAFSCGEYETYGQSYRRTLSVMIYIIFISLFI